MIERADQLIGDWMRKVAPGTEVSLAPPVDEPKGLSLHAVLIALERGATGGVTARAPGSRRAVAKYLICAAGSDASKAHAALGNLLFDAMEQDGFSVEFPGDLVSVWRALGCKLHPAFVLAVPVEKARHVKPAPRVQRHVPKVALATGLSGVVVAMDDVPVAGAVVEVRSLGISARTDAFGRFRLGVAPLTLEAGDVLVTARGLECRAGAVQMQKAGEPLVIRVTGLEAAE
jgi:hypothetical protein